MNDKTIDKGNFPNPTIVIFFGNIDINERNDLAREVSNRVAEQVNGEIIANYSIDAWDNDEDNQIDRKFDEFISNSYWKTLNFNNKDIISSKRIPDIMRGNKPEINVVFVGRENNKQALEAEQIEKINHVTKLLKKNHEKKSDINISLILSSENSNHSDQLKIKNKFGILTTENWKNDCDVFQNFIVLIVTSNFIEVIDTKFSSKSEQGWIILGASSIVVDVNSMYDYLFSNVFSRLLKPIVPEKLTGDMKQRINQDIDLIISNVSSSMMDGYNRVLSEDFEVAYGELGYEKVRLESKKQNDHPQWDWVFNLKSINPKGIYEYIKEFRKKIQDIVLITGNEKYETLLGFVKYLLEKEKTSENDPVRAINLDFQWNSGLRTAQHGLEYLVSKFKSHTSIKYKNSNIAPQMFESQEYLLNIVEDMAFEKKAYGRMFRRRERQYASPLAAFFQYIILFPIGFALLRRLSFLRIQHNVALIIPLVAVLILTLYQWYIRNQVITDQKSKISAKIEKKLLAILLGIVSKSIRDYYLVVVSKLKERLVPFEMVIEDVDTKYNSLEIKIRKLEQMLGGDDVKTTQIFELSDISICNSWVEKASKNVDEELRDFEGYAKKIIADIVFPIIANPYDVKKISDHLKPKARDVTNEYFVQDLLHVNVLSDNEPTLKHGLYWEWLYLNAQPEVGDISLTANAQYATLMVIGNKQLLLGAYGENSEHWPENTIIVESILEHEIQCVLGVKP